VRGDSEGEMRRKTTKTGKRQRQKAASLLCVVIFFFLHNIMDNAGEKQKGEGIEVRCAKVWGSKKWRESDLTRPAVAKLCFF
jgi:hypothetical protein